MARLSKRQLKQISDYLKLTRADRELIRFYKNNWESDRLDDIKAKIKNFYLVEQNKLCAYCRLPFRDDIQIEHVVPKGGKYSRPEFTFNTKNLVLACKHCNSKKSTNNDLIPWNRKQYPSEGSAFKIIHPHFDDYFKHISIVDKSRYVRLTLKGHKTIERCKLYDPVILGLLARYMRYEDDPLIQGVLRIRDLQGNFKNTIDALLDSIIKRFK